jgi:AraC-like DNA-binding protein/quercetin dioxygenase-like cupin family protein
MVKLKDGFAGSRAIILPESVVLEMSRNPFTSKLYMTDIGYYPKARHHFRKREKGIDQFILIYCVDGKGWVENDGKRYNVTADHFVILPAGKPHMYGADAAAPWTIYWLHFKGDMAGFYADGNNKPTAIASGDNSRISERLAIFEDMFKNLENGYSWDNICYVISSLHYFLGSIKFTGKFSESSARQEHSEDTIERVVRYMRDNIERRLTLDQLSEYLGYSSSHFSSIFKRGTGYSPINYFLMLKMQAACEMLDFTDMKINQICHKIGFDDPYYFSKLFTKTIGHSPSRYRALKKG